MQGELIAHSHAYGRNAVGSYSMLIYVKFSPSTSCCSPKSPIKVQNTKKDEASRVSVRFIFFIYVSP